MTREQAATLVREALVEEGLVNEEDPLLPTDKLSDFGDSLELIETTITLEESITTTFPKDLASFKTVNDLITFVENQELKNEQSTISNITKT